MLKSNKLINYIERLAMGNLTHEQIHGDGGHGAWITEAIMDFNALWLRDRSGKFLKKQI